MSKQKHIICCVTNDLVNDQRMQRICTALVNCGFKVTLVGRALPDSKALTRQAFQQHRIPCKYHKGKLFYLEYNYRLHQFLSAQKPDIINAVDLDTVASVFLYRKFYSVVTTFDAHEWFTEVPELLGRPISKWIWKLLESIAIKSFQASYTVSQSIADVYRSSYGVHMKVIRNLPLKNAYANEREQSNYMLYQGALNKDRGLEPLLRAMLQIERPLKIAGEGDLSAELRALVNRLALEDKVEFLGMLSPDALKEVTAKAWIGLNLLEGESMSYRFSLANKFFDYMQAGVPSISMKYPEYERINAEDEVSILVEKADEKSIIDAVNKLEEASDYQRLHYNAQRAAGKYYWEEEEIKLMEIYAAFA